MVFRSLALQQIEVQYVNVQNQLGPDVYLLLPMGVNFDLVETHHL